METRDNKQIVVFDPSEIISFKISESTRNSNSFLNIKNISESQLAFKIKLSNPTAFQIEESQGFISPGKTARIKFFYQYSKDSLKSYKFLVLICQSNCLKLVDVDWFNNPQEFKFWSNFTESDQKSSSESERERITMKNKELKDKIEKNLKKLGESKKLNYMTHEKMGVFGLRELVILFISGFLLGIVYSLYNI